MAQLHTTAVKSQFSPDIYGKKIPVDLAFFGRP
jgi:hypothetical protein